MATKQVNRTEVLPTFAQTLQWRIFPQEDGDLTLECHYVRRDTNGEQVGQLQTREIDLPRAKKAALKAILVGDGLSAVYDDEGATYDPADLDADKDLPPERVRDAEPEPQPGGGGR